MVFHFKYRNSIQVPPNVIDSSYTYWVIACWLLDLEDYMHKLLTYMFILCSIGYAMLAVFESFEFERQKQLLSIVSMNTAKLNFRVTNQFQQLQASLQV